MYLYFDKSKYYISAKKYPYVSQEQISEHNEAVREVEQLKANASELQAAEERSTTIVGLMIGALLCIPVFWLYISYLSKDDTTLALVFSAFFSIPILGTSYGLFSQYLPSSSELKSQEAIIKDKLQYLDKRLLAFEELKKKHAQYWLSMDGWQFEKEIAKLYESQGYDAVVTKGSDDGGIDIFLIKNGTRLGVQCKNYHKPVAQAVIRELAGAMLHENLDGGIVIASSGYTKRAKEFAENKPIKLLDINDILRMHANAFV